MRVQSTVVAPVPAPTSSIWRRRGNPIAVCAGQAHPGSNGGGPRYGSRTRLPATAHTAPLPVHRHRPGKSVSRGFISPPHDMRKTGGTVAQIAAQRLVAQLLGLGPDRLGPDEGGLRREPIDQPVSYLESIPKYPRPPADRASAPSSTVDRRHAIPED